MKNILTQGKVIMTSSTPSEILKRFNAIQIEGKPISEIDALISEYPDIPTYIAEYFYAMYHKRCGDIHNAAIRIRNAENSFNDRNITSILFQNFKKDFWGQAGEIYAAADMGEDSIRAFKHYFFYCSKIKSDTLLEGVLSFRAINEYSLEDLINNELTVSSPIMMNDPFDTLLLQWGDRYKLNSSGRKHSITMAKALEHYRIRCFSKLSNDVISNTLMWSHYANNHKGLCIHYVFSDEFIESIDTAVCRFKEIKYAPKEEIISIDIPSINTDLGLCTKQAEWQYEDEVRLICYMPDEEHLFVPLKIDNKSYIKAIYFGIKCPQHDINTIMKIHSGKPIKYYKMESNPKNIYKLKAAPM